MALNATGISTRYRMLHTRSVSPITSAQQIIDFVKAKGRLNHLAISCHGRVDHSSGATTLEIGNHFDSSNVGLFSQLKGSHLDRELRRCGFHFGEERLYSEGPKRGMFFGSSRLPHDGGDGGFADGQNGHE